MKFVTESYRGFHDRVGLENYRLLRQWLSGGPENYRTAGGEQLFDHELAEAAAYIS